MVVGTLEEQGREDEEKKNKEDNEEEEMGRPNEDYEQQGDIMAAVYHKGMHHSDKNKIYSFLEMTQWDISKNIKVKAF